MKKLIPILLLFITNISFAQNEFLESVYDYSMEQEVVVAGTELLMLEKSNIGLYGDIPFVNVVVEIDQPDNPAMLNNIWIRSSNDGIHWSTFQQVLKDPHADDMYENTKSDLLYFDKKAHWFQVKVVNPSQEDIKLTKLQLNFSAPSNNRNVIKTNQNSYREGCDLPDMLSRSEWCSSGECPIGGGVETEVTHLIVHHSAGTSETSNWGAVVRAIWHYHVDERGWDDIGYNWLIDGDGVLYQGRLDNIRGAHMCGKNTGTLGVCVLGNFQDFEPTDAAILTLSKLLAWKSDQKGLDPLATTLHSSSGKNLHTIVGHKDGCPPGYTSCPGTNLYPQLGGIRTSVNNILTDCIAMGIRDENYLDVSFRFDNIQKTIEIVGDITNIGFSVFNIYGQKVKSSSSISGRFINVGSLNKGSYFIQMYNKSSSKSFKFIVL